VSPARADTFAAGSLIIPMDTTYQDAGMLKAYGLVYNLLSHGVAVRWTINQSKAAQGNDFTASATDFATSAVITNHGYRGGPFVVDSANAAAAAPFITAWRTAHPSPATTVHVATTSFMCDVARTLVVAPRIAVLADGSQSIAIGYLNAASVPDSTGNPWPNASPDILTPAQVAGPTTTSHHDGALFDTVGNPVYCHLVSAHFPSSSEQAIPETTAEIRDFLKSPVHLFAECQSVTAFEGDSAYGRFLTSAGTTVGPQPMSVDLYHPTRTFAQLDGTFGPVGGSEPTWALAMGYKAGNVVMITGHGVAPGGGQDVWAAGYLDGVCAPDAATCGTFGKISYLGGHQYSTGTPISTNPTTQGVRLFLDSLFDSPCSDASGQPAVSISASAPPQTAVPSATYTFDYGNAAGAVALGATITDTLPPGTTFDSATMGGMFSGGTVTWQLGNLGPGAMGSVQVTVTLGGYGTYMNSAVLAYKSGLNPLSTTSNTASTDYPDCVTETSPPAVTAPAAATVTQTFCQ